VIKTLQDLAAMKGVSLNPKHGWTPDREALLKVLWTQGLSASEIAKRLGGVSRNAVIGKRIRMGLPERDGSAPRLTKAQAAKSLGKSVPVLVIDRSRETGAARGPHNIPFKDRTESSCLMFVGGESRETGLICGREREEGKPYCVACCGLAYAPEDVRRRRGLEQARRRA